MKPITAALSAIALTLLSATTFGTTITVVDPSGNSDFTVTYNTDEAGLFGTLFLSNNTIFFLPDGFADESNNGSVGAVVSETLNLQLNAVTAGFTFDTFFLREEGTYTVDGDNAEVYAYGEMRVRSSEDLTTRMSSFEFSDMGDQGPTVHDWEGSATLGSSDGWMGVMDPLNATVFLTLQNDLMATTTSTGERAFIQKKFEGVEIVVGQVPVPAAVWLFASAIMGLFGYRKAV